MTRSAAPKWLQVAALDDALSHGLTEKEFRHVVEILGREVNILELGICSALYSEHCSYKSTKVHLRTLPTEGPAVIQGPGENAGVVDIGDGKAVAFKIESHNHPSFIEPFQGAATGVGGILRDVFTMGARPVALMNALRFGDLSVPRTKYLLKRCVAGIGGYGNCVGVPTVGGELFFHPSYNGNCLVNAFALGIVDHDKIFLGTASGIGNAIFYVGSKTGRDGIHGATMASEAFDENSEEKRPTVQVGDPFQEKLLLEACIEAMATGAVVGIQDMGAAGMTSSTYEMADRAGTGVVIHLDRVPQRESHMNPYEIMLSESQERMLVVVEKGRENEVLSVFQRWELDAVQIGTVVEGVNVDLHWHGELVSSIPVSLLTSAIPQYRWKEEPPADFAQRLEFSALSISEPQDLGAVWLGMLGSPNGSSKRPVYNQYDSTVRTNTVVHPGGDAAVIRVKNEGRKKVEKGIAMTLDCNSRFCGIDPRQGTALSVAEAFRNITAVGASPIGISDCLNFGSPERPDGMWQIAESIRGLGEAARAFTVPVVSGNVSLYNETKGKPVLPTPVIAMVGLIKDASRCVGAHFQQAGDRILLIGETSEEDLGGTEYMAYYAELDKGRLPMLDYDREIATAEVIRELIDKRLLLSCHDLSVGGLAMAFAESCFGPYSFQGAELEIEHYEGRKDALLFAETGARYLISCRPGDEKKVREAVLKKKLVVSATGVVGGTNLDIKGVARLEAAHAYEAWRDGLKPFVD